MLRVAQVQPIVQAVKKSGDAAVKQFTEKFDKVKLDNVCAPIQVGQWVTVYGSQNLTLRPPA